jgi:hypothetical protein
MQQNAILCVKRPAFIWPATFSDPIISRDFGACILTNNSHGESPKTPVRLRMRNWFGGIKAKSLVIDTPIRQY